MADQMAATFRRTTAPGACGLCTNEKELIAVAFEGGTVSGAFCKACFLKLLHMQLGKLTTAAAASSGNGAPATAGRVS